MILLQFKKKPNEIWSLSKDVAVWLSLHSEHGVTAIEYGLIAGLIAIGIIAGVTLTGTSLASIFNFIAPKLAAP
jgi:pilus assembly protein Flp/PilA